VVAVPSGVGRDGSADQGLTRRSRLSAGAWLLPVGVVVAALLMVGFTMVQVEGLYRRNAGVYFPGQLLPWTVQFGSDEVEEGTPDVDVVAAREHWRGSLRPWVANWACGRGRTRTTGIPSWPR
jgi:hypothetical protein